MKAISGFDLDVLEFIFAVRRAGGFASQKPGSCRRKPARTTVRPSGTAPPSELLIVPLNGDRRVRPPGSSRGRSCLVAVFCSRGVRRSPLGWLRPGWPVHLPVSDTREASANEHSRSRPALIRRKAYPHRPAYRPVRWPQWLPVRHRKAPTGDPAASNPALFPIPGPCRRGRRRTAGHRWSCPARAAAWRTAQGKYIGHHIPTLAVIQAAR